MPFSFSIQSITNIYFPLSTDLLVSNTLWYIFFLFISKYFLTSLVVSYFELVVYCLISTFVNFLNFYLLSISNSTVVGVDTLYDFNPLKPIQDCFMDPYQMFQGCLSTMCILQLGVML